MNDLRKAAGEALEALEDVPYMSNKDDYERLERVKTALRQALEKPKYRRGDRLLCLETEEYCVIHISGTDRQYVKFPDGHVGQYTNQQVADHFELLPKEVDADDTRPQARSLTDELMDCVDRLGSEADTVDPRVWQHLLVYAPKPEEEPVAWITDGGKGELWWYQSSKFDEEGNLIGPNPDDIPLYTAPPKQEPVAWANSFDLQNFDMKVRTGPDLHHTVPLYTALPKRTWVGLTAGEVYECWLSGDVVAAVEAKLKEKNT